MALNMDCLTPRRGFQPINGWRALPGGERVGHGRGCKGESLTAMVPEIALKMQIIPA